MSEWSKEREREIRVRCAWASPGPWFAVKTTKSGNTCTYAVTVDTTCKFPFTPPDGVRSRHDIYNCDQIFISNSRDDLPDALDELDRRASRIAELEGLVEIRTESCIDLTSNVAELEQAVRTLRAALDEALESVRDYDSQSIADHEATLAHGDAAIEATKDLASGGGFAEVKEVADAAADACLGCACINDMPGDNYTCTQHEIIQAYRLKREAEKTARGNVIR